jgi:hypothetical protein
MTRVTSFLMPKRGQEASTFEEMQAGARKQDDVPKAEKVGQSKTESKQEKADECGKGGDFAGGRGGTDKRVGKARRCEA